jgi:hypothetical protein
MAEDSWSALLLVMVYLASVTLVKAGPGATSHRDVRDVMGVPPKTIQVIRPSGWWFQTFFIFHFIYGMSPFPLTNSIIFQDGYCTTNQP